MLDITNVVITLATDSRFTNPIFKREEYSVISESFFKRVFLKDEKSLLVYHTYINEQIYLIFVVQDFKLDKFLNPIYKGIRSQFSDGILYYTMDMIALSENRVIILSQQLNGRMLIIRIFDFMSNYTKHIKMTFNINIINQRMHLNSRHSLIFKYKDTFGLQFENTKGENGFIIFGYFNSSDPKQIYNIKKDGLDYTIKLNEYLFLQSNIFGYKIKGIKIIAIPEINSGLYFISKITKKELKLNEIINYNTEITLNFARDIIYKGKYLFKFAGVLKEPNFDEFFVNSVDEINTYDQKLLDEYSEFYENNRNKNIIGKAALVQINILDDIKIFCDEKIDETCLKSNNTCLTCGKGKFYDVENANEITQLLIGENYYFDNYKKVFVKCHKR